MGSSPTSRENVRRRRRRDEEDFVFSDDDDARGAMVGPRHTTTEKPLEDDVRDDGPFVVVLLVLL